MKILVFILIAIIGVCDGKGNQNNIKGSKKNQFILILLQDSSSNSTKVKLSEIKTLRFFKDVLTTSRWPVLQVTETFISI
jgi:hypothetical protein